MGRLRVLFVCPRDTYFKDWYGLAGALRSQGCDVVPLSPSYAVKAKGGSRAQTTVVKPVGVRTVPLGDFSGHAALDIWDVWTLEKCIVNYHPDVVHVMGEASYIVTSQLAKILRKRKDIILSCRAAQNVYQEWPGPLAALERRSFDRLDGVFYLSSDARMVLEKKGYKGRLYYLPNGYDRDVFWGEPRRLDGSSTVRIGFVGRLMWRKGPDILLQALGQVKKLQWSAVIAGDGPMRQDLERMAIRLGIADRVKFVGEVQREDLAPLYREIDVLVVPSRSSGGSDYRMGRWVPFLRVKWKEQFARVIVEGMACGCPVVGAASGAIPEVIGDAGWTFSEGDASSLARVLEQIFQDLQVVNSKSLRALRRSKTFSWDAVAARLLAGWEAIMLEKKGG